MKNKKTNAAVVWKQFEDVMMPRLRLTTSDRAVYAYLLRHSRLEGKLRLRFSIAGVARGACLCIEAVRAAVRRLIDHGALRLLERSKAGHVVEVYLPQEIPHIWTDPNHPGKRAPAPKSFAPGLEEADFFRKPELRESIHVREGDRCFYCLRQTNRRLRCLDHVVPQAQSGRHSYRNLVSCCLECNSWKGERPATDFLRWLYHKRALTTAELSGRLRALEELASGKLRPRLPATFSDRCAVGR